MQTRVYIKPKSQTQVSASAFIRVVQEVLRAAHISVDCRSDVLFEVGCAFVERYIRDEKFQKYLLQYEESAFWTWWVVEFMRDDEALLCYRPDIFIQYDYGNIKRGMISDTSVYDAFARFLEPIKF